MNEAIGNSFVLNFIITFIIIFMLIFIAALTYTKAYKVKNRIIDTIENYEGEITSSNGITSEVEAEINDKLGQMGYRVDPNNECKTDGRFEDSKVVSKGNNYRYCIYKFTTNKGDYYGVVAYAYLEIPIIGTKIEYPVYGETRTFINL